MGADGIAPWDWSAGSSLPGKVAELGLSSYLAGNVVASLPEGFTFPLRTSAMEFHGHVLAVCCLEDIAIRICKHQKTEGILIVRPWAMVEVKWSDGAVAGHLRKLQAMLGEIRLVQVCRQEKVSHSVPQSFKIFAAGEDFVLN
jgi:hypothetical protein